MVAKAKSSVWRDWLSVLLDLPLLMLPTLLLVGAYCYTCVTRAW